MCRMGGGVAVEGGVFDLKEVSIVFIHLHALRRHCAITVYLLVNAGKEKHQGPKHLPI